MRIPESARQYLAGEAYSNGLELVFEQDDEDRRYRSRLDILSELCAGRDVVHVGCVDHDVESIVRKRKKNKWLHGLLCESARRCHGVDIQERGIRYIREELGYPDVESMDILTQPSTVLDGENWDYILVPEVLEHMDDPLSFLGELGKRFSENAGKLVVTVPNAFAGVNYGNAKKGREVINSDHRFWFTPFTIAKLAVLAGLSVDRLIMCRHGVVKRRSIFKNRYFRKYPLLRSDIVAILSFQDGIG